MEIIKLVKAKDYLTIGNFTCGMLTIIFSIREEFMLASYLLLGAVVFDFLDGRVARMTGTENEFGRSLDSLADIVSFGAAPVIFGYCQGLSSFLSVIVLVFFSACGALRLSRFMAYRTKDFVGVPITVNGFLFPGLYILLGRFNPYHLVAYAALGMLMISSIRVRKL